MALINSVNGTTMRSSDRIIHQNHSSFGNLIPLGMADSITSSFKGWAMRNNKIEKSPIGTGDYPKEIKRKSKIVLAKRTNLI